MVFQLNPATLRNWPEFLKNNFETLPRNDIPDFFLSPCPVEFVDYFDDPTENEAEEEDEDDRPETGGHFDQFLWQHCHSADIHLQFTFKPRPHVITTQDYPFTSSVCMSATLIIPPRDFEIVLNGYFWSNASLLLLNLFWGDGFTLGGTYRFLKQA